jgi:hypothetical protein
MLSCKLLWYGEQPNAIAMQMDFCNSLYKNKFKALNTLINSAENTISSEKVFVFQCLNLAWTQQQVDSM